MSPRFVLGWENVPCVAEVVNRSLKADCTDFTVSRENGFVNCDFQQLRLILSFCAFKNGNNGLNPKTIA